MRPLLPCLCITLLATACGGDRTTAPAAAPEGPPAVAATIADPPAAPGALAPRLSEGSDGLWLTWLEPVGDDQHRLLLSRLGDEGTWAEPIEIVRGSGFFANWADLPGVAEAADGSLVAHWLEMLGEGTYAYGVQLARSTDGGRSWERIGLLHDDDSPTEHGFVSWVREGEHLRAFWLDGRAMAAGEPMQLRTTLVNGSPAQPSVRLDDRVCECCDTAAATAGERSVVVYRDRTEDEIRDFAVIHGTEEGWSEPVTVSADGWKIAGCPVNGADAASDGGAVAVAWFTAAESRPRVFAAFSRDAGATFGDEILVDDERPMGRVGVAMGPDGAAWVSWMTVTDPDAGEAEIRLQRVTAEGPLGEPTVVATTGARRSAGFPQLARLGDTLVVVWVEDGEPARIRAAGLAS